MPVCAFTCISANVSSSTVLFDESTVPSHAPRKPSGMEMMPGLESGMNGLPVNIAPPDGSHTLGLIDTSTSALIRPVRLPHKAPVALNLFQKTVNTISGRVWRWPPPQTQVRQGTPHLRTVQKLRGESRELTRRQMPIWPLSFVLSQLLLLF